MFQHNRNSKKGFENEFLVVLRILVYVFGLGELLYTHGMKIVKSCMKQQTVKLFGKIPIPDYLEKFNGSLTVVADAVVDRHVRIRANPILYDRWKHWIYR